MPPKDTTHHNHYIPQRYQLGFSEGGEEKVWVYDRQADSYRPGHPKTVGVMNDFYTTQGLSGEPTDEVEKCLAMLEGTVWPIIGRLDARNREWNKDDRANLALFVALMKTRVPAFDKEQNQFAEDFFRRWAKATNPTPEVIAESVLEATGEAIDLNKAVEIYQIIHKDGCAFENPGATSVIPPSARTLLCLRDDGLRSATCYRVTAHSDRFVIARDEPHLRSLVKKTKAGDWRNEVRIGFGAPNPAGGEPNV